MVGTASRASYANEPWFPQVREFADQMRKIREQTGFTQKDVADLIGVDRTAVFRWESANAVPAKSDVVQYAQFFDLGQDFMALWRVVRERIDRLANLKRSRARSERSWQDQPRPTRPEPLGYEGAWWDPVPIDPVWTNPSHLDFWMDSSPRLDVADSLKSFDVDLLVVEEFEEYEPWDGSVPRRLPAPGLHRVNHTPPRHGLPAPQNEGERLAWKDWMAEQQVEARQAFIRSQTVERARKERKERLEMKKSQFVMDGSYPQQCYDLLKEAGTRGLTAHELAQMVNITDLNVGAALSGLHKRGMIARLVEIRRAGPGSLQGGRIYVLPGNVDGRPTLPYGRKAVSEAIRANKTETKVERKVHLKVVKGARRLLPDDLRAQVEKYQEELEIAGTIPEVTGEPPTYEIPWTPEQRMVIRAYWEGLNEGDITLASFLVSNQDRFK